jgi:hypothetical protein
MILRCSTSGANPNKGAADSPVFDDVLGLFRLRISASATWAGLLLSLLLPGRALAFNFEEHEAIGDRAFERVCLESDPVSQSPERWAPKLEGALGKQATCKNLLVTGTWSYGRLAGLSADIVESPYMFLDAPDKVDEVAHSGMEYLRLAHFNYKHFQLDSIKAYKAWHRAAILEALSKGGDGDVAARLHRALAVNAFADHFLADSFAAGHIRPDRKGLADSLSKKLHDRDNSSNFGPKCWKVKNVAGETWCPHGDGYLATDIQDPEFQRIVKATAVSIEEVLEAAYHPPTDTSLNQSGFMALNEIPIRPNCAEQPSILGRTSCYSMFEFGDLISLGGGTDEWIGMSSTGQTVAFDVEKALIATFGLGLQVDVWTRTSQRTTVFTGATTWLPDVRPNLFVRSWPRRESYFGFEWLSGVRVGYPIFFAPQVGSVQKRLKSNFTDFTFPDVAAYVNILLYSLNVRFEMGFGTFLSYDGTVTTSSDTGGWSEKRGGKLALSAVYSF